MKASFLLFYLQIYSQAGVVGDKDILIRSSNMDGKPYLVISDRKPSYTGPQKAMTAKRIMITYRGKLGRLRDSER